MIFGECSYEDPPRSYKEPHLDQQMIPLEMIQLFKTYRIHNVIYHVIMMIICKDSLYYYMPVLTCDASHEPSTCNSNVPSKASFLKYVYYVV